MKRLRVSIRLITRWKSHIRVVTNVPYQAHVVSSSPHSSIWLYPYSLNNYSISLIGDIPVPLRRSFRARVEAQEVEVSLLDRDENWKVDNPLMVYPPIYCLSSSSITCSSRRWDTMGVGSLRLVPTWSTFNSRRKRWLPQYLDAKSYHFGGISYWGVMWNRHSTFVRWVIVPRNV